MLHQACKTSATRAQNKSLQDSTSPSTQSIGSPFGCPVYVLDEKLQMTRIFPRWNTHSKVGIYLGQSLIHNQNITLTLNLQSRYMSPQFHIQFDPHFHMVRQLNVTLTWMEQTGFVATQMDADKTKEQATKRMKQS
jgi:hypothetical protein